MDQRREYAASFLEDSLGLSRGSIDPGDVPNELLQSLVEAVRGSDGSRSDTPILEAMIQRYGEGMIESTLDSRGFVIWKERWPRAARFAACLTHDVDNVSWPVSHLLKQMNRFSAVDFVLGLIGVRNLYDNTSLAVRMERERNLRSSFYFLTGAYDIKPKAKLLASIHEEGWDIGLHGAFGTHDSAEEMDKAVKVLSEAVQLTPRGVREHYLRFDFGSTWGIMEKAGFVYDSTVGNTDKTGFRIGLCNPFHPPSEDWTPLDLLEIPLGLMDATLWGYLKRTEAEGLSDFARLKDSVRQVNGLFTILWHPESFRMRGGRIYPKLLDLLIGEQCFIGSGLDIAEWWQKRGAPLMSKGKTFRMDDAPAGLVLKVRSKGSQMIRSTGGIAKSDGDLQSVEAKGGHLELVIE